MTRPVIGITRYVEPASPGRWVDLPAPAARTPTSGRSSGAGGLALLVPPRPTPTTTMAATVAGPARRPDPGRRRRRRPGPVRRAAAPERAGSRGPTATRRSWRWPRRRADADLPVLGICRGMQVMAVAAGGTLEQHLPDRVGHDGTRPAPGVYGGTRCAPSRARRLARLLGDRGEVAAVPPPVGARTHPGYVAGGLVGRRDARGDGGPRRRVPARRCSGTRRRARTPGCSRPWSPPAG